MDPALTEVLKQFGLASPLVIILFYLLRQAETRERLASQERKETSERYMTAMSTVVSDTRLVLQQVTASVTEEIATSREARAHDREEHRAMIDAERDNTRILLEAIGKIKFPRESM